MREYRRCVICNKPYVATRANSLCCSEECSKYRRKEVMASYDKAYKAKRAEEKRKPKKKKQTVTDIAVEARKAGMTYGQYVAMVECGMAVERRGET